MSDTSTVCNSCGIEAEYQVDGLCAVCLLGEGRDMLDATVVSPQTMVDSYLHRHGFADATQVNLAGPPGEPKAPSDSHPGKYDVNELVAKGGMGAIYNAHDLNIRRSVAMKVMLGPDRASREQILRFVHEAQVTGQLEHPNIVPVHEIAQDEDDNLYYTMKLIDGRTLEDIIKRIREGDKETIATFPLSHLLSILMRACDAIAYAHSRGVVHRDLKPENIMVGDFGEVLVLDWGLAKIMQHEDAPSWATDDEAAESTANSKFETYAGMSNAGMTMEGEMLGTPAYMAPEQAKGKISQIGPCSDIYALGGILYSILCLRSACAGGSVQKVLLRVSRGDIKSPYEKAGKRNFGHLPGGRIPEALSAVTMKAMALAPEDRYADVKDLQAEIQAYRDGFATSAEDAGAVKLLTLFIKRHKGLAAAALVMLALIVAALVKVKASEGDALAARDEAKATLVELGQSNLAQQRISVKAAPEFVTKANALLANGDVGKAFDAAETAVGLASELHSAWHVKGRVHLANLHFELAETAFNKARQLKPEEKSYRALRNIAANHRHLGTQSASEPQIPRNLSQQMEEAGDTILAGLMFKHLGDETETLKRRALHALNELETLNPGLEFRRDTGYETGFYHYHWHHIFRDNGEVHFFLPHMNDPKKLSNISPLKGLPLTAFTSLPGSSVSDLTPLAGAPLKHIFLGDMPIVGLAGVRGLPLETLTIGRSQVSDLSPLRGMQLRKLHLDTLPVSDLSPIQGMPIEDISINNTGKVTDLSPLRGMPLKSVHLGSMAATKLAPILDAPIEHLSIKGPVFEDLNEIGHLPLKGLIIYSSGILDLEILAGKQLETFYQVYGKVDDAMDYAKLTAQKFKGSHYLLTNLDVFRDWPLTYFQISGEDISDISALAGKKLDYLSIRSNHVRDISILKDMPLTNVNIYDAPIESIDVLAEKRITEIRLHGTKVRDISVLAEMPIHYAEFYNCENLTDLTPLKTCTRLRTIGLPPNYGDISFVKDLPGKPALRIGGPNQSYMQQDAFFAKHPVDSRTQ